MSNEFLDVLTGARIRTPVLAADGRLYDRDSLTAWFQAREATGKPIISPITNEAMDTTLTVDDAASVRLAELLEDLARGTGGRYLPVKDARTLPRILTKEAVTASQALLIEKELRPRHLGQLDALGLDMWPGTETERTEHDRRIAKAPEAAPNKRSPRGPQAPKSTKLEAKRVPKPDSLEAI